MSGFAPLGSIKGTAGNGLGLGGIAGALGALLQGFTAGKQLKLQNQESEQQIQGEKLRNGLGAFQMLQGLSPEALASPAVKTYLQSLGNTGGLPLTDAQGNVNTTLFQHPITSFTQSPQFKEFQEADPTTRATMLDGLNLSDPDKQKLLGLPTSYSDPTRNSAQTAYDRLTYNISNGVVPVTPQTVASANRLEGILGLPTTTAADYGLGAKTQATVDSANALTGQRKASTVLTQDKDVMQKMRNKIFPKQSADAIALTEARTGMTLAETAAIPMKAAAAVQNSLTAQGRLGVEQQRLAMAVSDFKANGGMTNGRVNMLRGIQASLGTATNQARVASDAAEKAASAYALAVPGASRPVAPGQPPTPAQAHYQSLLEAAQHTKGRLNQMLIDQKKMPGVIQQFIKGQLTKGGGKNSWEPVLKDVDNTTKTPMTQAQLVQAAKANKMTVQAAQKYAESHGYTIVP